MKISEYTDVVLRYVGCSKAEQTHGFLLYCTGHMSTATITHVPTNSTYIPIYKHEHLLWMSILGHLHGSHGEKISLALPNKRSAKKFEQGGSCACSNDTSALHFRFHDTGACFCRAPAGKNVKLIFSFATIFRGFTFSHLDYCNALFTGFSKKCKNKLQEV